MATVRHLRRGIVPHPPADDITTLLHAVRRGESGADEQLFAAVYDELRSLARSLLRRESSITVEPTGLVHEAFLRLDNRAAIDWVDRHHFYGVAARAMRRVLVDRARARQAAKRHGTDITLPELAPDGGDRSMTILAVDVALEELARLDERQARVVELRWFAGLSVEEAAAVLDVAPATVKRDWAAARAWLARALADARTA
jgi:RNA polymerase sigma factor (TIGR02999 family)